MKFNSNTLGLKLRGFSFRQQTAGWKISHLKDGGLYHGLLSSVGLEAGFLK
jgi:hypothetical protein